MILQGNSYRIPLADNSVHAVITSPPYWNLRDYNVDGQIGLEPTIAEYVAAIVQVFREVKRVLHPTGIAWVNLGDTYATSRNGRSAADTKAAGNDDRTFRDKPFSIDELPAKNLCLIPFRVAIALQEDGWIVRSDIIWSKRNPMPESVTDRPTKSHEYIFMLTKGARYFYDATAVREISIYPDDNRKARASNEQKRYPNEMIAGIRSGSAIYPNRNRRTVWELATEPYAAAHYATFPTKLVEPMVLASTSARGVCPECGRQWERVTEATPEYEAFRIAERERKGGSMRSNELETLGLSRGTSNKSVTAQSQTTGWRPTCKCGENLIPIPAVILDPFCGSGTVGQVCRELNRRFIGIDLSATYLQENALPRAEFLTSEKALAQLPMFAPPGGNDVAI